MGGGGQIDPPPPRIFWPSNFAPWPIVKSFGTTVPCLWAHLLTLIKWRHRWWRHHKSHAICENKWSLLYVPNFKSIGWIMSKVEGGGGSDWPPPPSRLRVTIFSRRLLGLMQFLEGCCGAMVTVTSLKPTWNEVSNQAVQEMGQSVRHYTGYAK